MANIDHEYVNFSKAARIVLELDTKVLREYLTTVTPPTSLPQTIVNLKVLNQSQKRIVQNIFNILSFEECDSSLLYILIRNYCNITPASGWCKPVKPHDTHVGDDVERMRVLRNELYGHATTARLSNNDYNSFIQDIRGIMIRFDSCHGGTYPRCPSTGTFEKELNKINTSPMDPVLQKHYNTLFIELSDIQTELVILDKKIDTVVNNVYTTDTKIDAVKMDLELHKTKIDMVVDIVNKTDSKIDAAEMNLNLHETKIDIAEKELVIHDTRIQISEKTSAMLKAKFNAIEKDCEDHGIRIETTEKKLEMSNAKVDNVSNDILMHDTKIATLEKNFTECETDLKSHGDKILCLENTFGTQKEKLDSLAKDVKTLKKVKPTNITSKTTLVPHEHDLEYVYRMNWVCNKCGISSKNERSYYCVLCNYDECIVCASVKQKQSNQCTIETYPLEDDQSPHSHFVNGMWSITSHHSWDGGPIRVLRHFDREKFISKGEKNQRLYESGYINYYSEEEFDKELEKKFLSTFSPEFKNQPWLMNNMHTDCDLSNNFHDICDILRAWSISTPYSFLVINYSLEDHAKKLGIDLNKLKKELRIYEDEDESKRILLYRGDVETLFNIRCTDSTSKEDICNEVIKAQNDVTLFSALHYNNLTNSNVSIVSMVVMSNLEDEDLTVLDICKECIKESLIVSKDTITTHLDYIERRRSEINKEGDNIMRKKTTFLSLVSRIIGFISIADVHLPNISVDGAEQLSRIYLNKALRDFCLSKRKHSILQGGFGSGKTILAQLRFKKIIQTTDPDDSIYFVIHSNETLLRNLIQLMVDEIPNKQLKNDHIFVVNANEYCQKFGLIAPLMVSDILQDITERHENLPGRPHLIIDELEGSSITENEGTTIKECLHKLLDSFILLVTHSLEVFREKVTSKYYLLTEKEYYNGFHYDATGMKIIVLDHIMRNTTGINAMAQSTIQTLKGSVAVFYERQIDSSMITSSRDIEEVDKYENISSDENQIKVEYGTIGTGILEKQSPIGLTQHDISSLNGANVKNIQSSGINSKQVVGNNNLLASIGPDNDIAMANINLKEDLSFEISPNAAEHEYYTTTDTRKGVLIEGNTAGTTTKNIRIKTVRKVSANMDHVLKQINNIPGKKSRNRIISKFNFPGSWDNGHCVKGKIPMLYYPFEDECLNSDNINDLEIRERLCYVLRNINTPRSPIIGMGIICFEIIDSLLFYEILKALGCPVILYTPAMDADTKPMDIPHIRDILERHVIITDHIGSRGLEFKKLILCVNPNETFLHQYLLEGMTRCIYELHVIVIYKESKGNPKNTTCGKIIKNWIKAGLVKKQVITICTENHNEDDDDINLVRVLCKEVKGKHFIHLLQNSLKVLLVPIKEVTIDFGKCFDIYYTELSNTQHIDDLTRRKRNEQNIQQECKRKGFPSYLDVIRGNKTKMISYLMKKKYDEMVKFRDFKDRGLLNISIEIGAEDSAISFIENGMPFEVSFQQFKNAREYAQYLGRTKVVEVIDDYYKRWIQPYETASDKHNHVKEIIRSNRNEELGHILTCFPEVIRLRSELFDTPLLHIAAWHNNMVAMEMLISRGADVYAVDSNGRNILHNITILCDDDSLECLRYLVTKYNQLVRGKDEFGRTPIDMAKRRNKHNLVKVLEKYHPNDI